MRMENFNKAVQKYLNKAVLLKILIKPILLLVLLKIFLIQKILIKQSKN